MLILSRSTGSIIRSTGSIARDEAAALQYAGVVYKHIKACEELVGGLEGVDEGGEAGAGIGEGGGKEGAAAGKGDDLRLVRIRTRRRELVVVPGKCGARVRDGEVVLGGDMADDGTRCEIYSRGVPRYTDGELGGFYGVVFLRWRSGAKRWV